MNPHPINDMKEVYETDDADDANDYIRQGWKLLGVFQRATEANGRPAACVRYALGKPDPAAAARVTEIQVAWGEGNANQLLRKGWEMLFTYIRKDEEGEHPRFVFGKPSTAPQPKFTGNGVH